MTRLLSVADTAVRRWAPAAPENVRDEAIIRIVGYVYDLPTVPGPGFRVSRLRPSRKRRRGLACALPFA